MSSTNLTDNKLTLADADELYYNHRSAYEGLKEEINRLNEELMRRLASIVAYEKARAYYAACEMNIEAAGYDTLKAEEALKKAASEFFCMPSGRSFYS